MCPSLQKNAGTPPSGLPGRAGPPLLSVCMIVRDEEKMLPGCLANVQAAADEIVVVDTGSTDRTLEIAREFGARIFEHRWQHSFSLHRNQCLSQARGEWILQIDADERLAPGHDRLLRERLAQAPPSVPGLFITICDFNARNTLNSTFNHPRLFRNGIGVRYEGIVHEEIVIPGEIAYSTLQIYHYGYDLDRRTMLQKFRRNTKLLRMLLHDCPADPKPAFYLATMYHHHKKFARAIAYAQEAVRRLGRHPAPPIGYLSVYTILASALTMTGNLAAARDICEQLIANYPDYPDGLLERTRLAYWQQQFADVERFGRRFLATLAKIERDPTRMQTVNLFSAGSAPLAKCWIGIALLAQNQLDEGIGLIEQGLAGPEADLEQICEMVQNAIVVSSPAAAKKIVRSVLQRRADEAALADGLHRFLQRIGYAHLAPAAGCAEEAAARAGCCG